MTDSIAPNPRDYGLPPRTRLERISRGTIALIIERKSRIIMADGQKILKKACSIKRHDPQMRVVLKTTAPVCSKTTHFLHKNGIELIQD